MKFVKVIKSTKKIKSELTDIDLDTIQEIVNNIIAESDLSIETDRHDDSFEILMSLDGLGDNYESVYNKFEDLLVEIKIQVLQKFRSKVQFNPIWGDSIGMSISSK